MRRLGFLVASLLALSLLGAPAALAATPPTTDTSIVKDATTTFPAVNPCTDPPVSGTVTIDYLSIFHVTDFSNGVLHITGTNQGTLTFVPDDASEVTYTGHIAAWFGTNSNASGGFEATDTFALHARGSDGSTLTLLMLNHITVTPSGDIASEFHVVRCR
jgi:hypothetical protein